MKGFYFEEFAMPSVLPLVQLVLNQLKKKI